MRGHVRKRGKAWVIVYDEPGQDGQRKQRWRSGYKTKREAEQALTSVLDRLARGAYAAPTSLSFGEYLTDQWLPAVRSTVRPTTYALYERMVRNHISKGLGATRLQTVSAPALTAFYAKLVEGGLAASTVRLVAAIASRSLKDATRWGLLTRNPAREADLPRVGCRPIRVWTATALGRFLEVVEGERDAALWRVLALTGCRRGEALALQWLRVDLEAGRIAIDSSLVQVAGEAVFSEPKTSAARRRVALDPETTRALREHRDRQLAERAVWGSDYQDNDLVFAREDGTPLWPDTISQRFQILRKQAKLPAARLHDLRHLHATLALSAGIHPKVVQERLGHSSITQTLGTYSHVLPGLQESAAAIVAALVDEAPVSSPLADQTLDQSASV